MASNSHIISYKFEDTLYLRLTGDFNEGSAHELINTLTKNVNDSLDIFIDTNNIETIHPLGRATFKMNFSNLKKQFKKLIIIGVNKYKFEQDLEQ